jgi:hypothetical protein
MALKSAFDWYDLLDRFLRMIEKIGFYSQITPREAAQPNINRTRLLPRNTARLFDRLELSKTACVAQPAEPVM